VTSVRELDESETTRADGERVPATGPTVERLAS
jgi:hypothetical protein